MTKEKTIHSGAPTPHNRAKPGEIAETILLPGDPLRAKYIAENYLEDPLCYNDIRGMLGYTGYYKGRRVSVQGTGMGMPSMAIYSHELIHFYGCKNLIRIGTAGAIDKSLKIGDLVIGMGACHDSNFDAQYQLAGKYAPIASFKLLNQAYLLAEKLEVDYKVGNILTSSIFYGEEMEATGDWSKMGILAVEMEAAALYMNAARAGVDALCILTISDNEHTGEMASPEMRQTGFDNMVKIALELAE